MKLSSNKIKLNFLFVIVLILVTFGSYLFIQKVYALQFIESDFFENQALSYRQRVEILEAKRGTIYDKNFNVLASSVQSYNVAVKSNDIDDLGFVSVLSSLLNLDEAEILKKITKSHNMFLHFDIFGWNTKPKPGKTYGGLMQGVRSVGTAIEEKISKLN